MTDDLNKLDQLKETFWNNHRNIKRKSTQKSQLEAQKQQMWFCHDELSKLTEDQLMKLFGDYVGFVKRWINSELVTNKFGKHLYVKLA